MTEQLQWLPFVNARLHEPFVKFIYWSLRQLDAGTQVTESESVCRESCVQYCGAPDLALCQGFPVHSLHVAGLFPCLLASFTTCSSFSLCSLSQCSGSLWASELCNKEFYCVRLLLKLNCFPALLFNLWFLIFLKVIEIRFFVLMSINTLAKWDYDC